jgi:hypothetical protein
MLYRLFPLVIAGLLVPLACRAPATDDAEPAAEPLRGADQLCGGFAGLRCDEGLTCFFPEGSCGAGDRGGTCKSRPQFCPDLYQPVCGCDQRTYPNLCAAAREGASVARRGTCEAPAEAPLHRPVTP